MFNLSLNNYRSFNSETFNFSKINILIGENSSGKSSIFKFLLALKQTLQPLISNDINLQLSGVYTDLGMFKEAVYYHKEDLRIGFGFEFGADYFEYYSNSFGRFRTENKSTIIQEVFEEATNSKYKIKLEFSVNKELDKHETIQTKISHQTLGELIIEHFVDNEDNSKSDYSLCNLKFLSHREKKVYLITNVEYTKEGFLTLIDGSSLRENISQYIKSSKSVLITSSLNEQVEIIYTQLAFLLFSQNYLRRTINKTQYINPINTHPSRLYFSKDPTHSASVRNIEDVIEILSRSTFEAKRTLVELNQIVKKFGLVDEIEIIKDTRLPVSEMRVKVKDLLSNIMDVGYGVSLQLPIILKALLAERDEEKHGSILLIEQPEVHLHPKLHAELIDTLMSLSKNTTYFIETHSEHIVRKLQEVVKSGRYGIKPSDITIHYLKRVDKKSEISVHQVDTNGKLSPNFPTGFFDNSYLLAKQLLD